MDPVAQKEGKLSLIRRQPRGVLLLAPTPSGSLVSLPRSPYEERASLMPTSSSSNPAWATLESRVTM